VAVAVRPARADDCDGFVDAFESVAAEGRWLGAEAPVDREAMRSRFRTWVDDPRCCVLLAVDARGATVGWIFAEHHPSGKVGIGMGVVAGHRGSGVGTHLLTRALAWAREQAAFKVVLEVWPHNTAAVRLYEKLGFSVEGRHRRHWRRRDGSLWDSLSMGLVLDEEAPGGPDH
jgi:putative acetyltransferase